MCRCRRQSAQPDTRSLEPKILLDLLDKPLSQIAAFSVGRKLGPPVTETNRNVAAPTLVRLECAPLLLQPLAQLRVAHVSNPGDRETISFCQQKCCVSVNPATAAAGRARSGRRRSGGGGRRPRRR